MNKQKRKFTVLSVMPDQETQNLFLRIKEHPKVVERTKDGSLEVLTTIYEDFVENKIHDTYDAVALVFMKDFKQLDL